MRRQYLITIRIDADNSEGLEYFTHDWVDGRTTLDPEQITSDNHEVIEYFEICSECGNDFDDNPGKGICKTCEDWKVTD